MTIQNIAEYNSIANAFILYVDHHQLYSDKSIANFKYLFISIQKRMVELKIKRFDKKSSEKIALSFEKANKSHDVRSAINHLLEFIETGTILPSKQYIKKPRDLNFEGTIGKLIKEFIISLGDQIKPRNKRSLENDLSKYNSVCQQKKIKELSLISVTTFIQNFKCKPTMTDSILRSVKKLTKYAAEKKIIKQDFSRKIPKAKRVVQPRNPSTYTPQEIKKITLSIDNNSPIGKRNLAIFLLASNLGIRGTDIINLQFDFIDWEKETLTFSQSKTDVINILPILPPVMDALIDYIKNGRLESDLPYLFLKSRSPWAQITDQTIQHLLERMIIQSGVKRGHRASGARSLRASLATYLLSEGYSIETIKRILGHTNIDMARHYLRFDPRSLSNCIQEVPLVNNKFYTENIYL